MKTDIEGIQAILKGTESGKDLVILAGVHGNETCGIQAFEEVLPKLRIERGTVTFILGNPRAIEKGVRFTEVNLNRMFRPDSELPESVFPTYEYQRSRELMPLLEGADAVLDIHSSGTKESIPFTISTKSNLSISKQFGFPIASYGWDSVEPGATDDFVDRAGGHGFCIECGYHDDPDAVQRSKDAIYTFLAEYNAISPVQKPLSDFGRVIKVTGLYKSKTDFVPTCSFSDFEPVLGGVILGTDGGNPVVMPANGIVIFVRARQSSEEEAFIFGVDEAQ